MVKLHVIDGPNKGESWTIGKDILFLGRRKENDIRLNDPSVSGRHLRIQKKKDTIYIEDLDSTNGTFLNGQSIISGHPVEVREGDLITVGNTLISLDAEFTLSGTLIHRASRDLRQVEKVKEVGLPKDRPMTALKNLELIYRVSSALMQSFDIQEILETFMDSLFECLKRIERGAVLLIEDGTEGLKEIITRSRVNKRSKSIRYSKSIVTRVINEGKPVVMTDISLDKDADLSDSIRSMKIRSVMCVPLISRSHVKGVIYVDSLKEPHGFRKEDLRLLMALASPASIAIENALMYSNLERMVESRTKSLKEAEKRLRKSESRFRAIFDNMESGVVVCEAEGQGEEFVVIDVNHAAERIDKVRKDKILGKRVEEAFPGFKTLGLLSIFHRVWESGKPEQVPPCLYEGGHAQGWREFDIHRLPSGELVIIYRDITDEKRAEEEQRMLQKKLMHSQKLESVGRLAGGVAHNFRNILQAILGNAEYLQMVKHGDAVVEEAVRNINNSVDKGVDLIHSLMHFSKLGEELKLEILDLAEVIRDTYRIIEKVFDKRIEITLDLEDNLFIKGNRGLLSQVFMNLFNNAKDAMPEGGKLGIKGARSQNRVVAWVSDTGLGMDRATLEKIFDPFFTLKEVGKGTGLGLSTVHGIVEEHKGTITVSSAPGKGTTFRLSFPLVRQPGVNEELEPLPRDLKFGKGEKVLVVDDERNILGALASMTERLGYKVKPVEEAKEAIKVYQKWRPHVVLMDRNMPGMDGISCTKEILKVDPEARVVIVSGYEESGPNGIDDSIRDLIRGYMTKPCGIEELSNILAAVLNRSGIGAGS